MPGQRLVSDDVFSMFPSAFGLQGLGAVPSAPNKTIFGGKNKAAERISQLAEQFNAKAASFTVAENQQQQVARIDYALAAHQSALDSLKKAKRAATQFGSDMARLDAAINYLEKGEGLALKKKHVNLLAKLAREHDRVRENKALLDEQVQQQMEQKGQQHSVLISPWAVQFDPVYVSDFQPKAKKVLPLNIYGSWTNAELEAAAKILVEMNTNLKRQEIFAKSLAHRRWVSIGFSLGTLFLGPALLNWGSKAKFSFTWQSQIKERRRELQLAQQALAEAMSMRLISYLKVTDQDKDYTAAFEEYVKRHGNHYDVVAIPSSERANFLRFLKGERNVVAKKMPGRLAALIDYNGAKSKRKEAKSYMRFLKAQTSRFIVVGEQETAGVNSVETTDNPFTRSPLCKDKRFIRAFSFEWDKKYRDDPNLKNHLSTMEASGQFPYNIAYNIQYINVLGAVVKRAEAGEDKSFFTRTAKWKSYLQELSELSEEVKCAKALNVRKSLKLVLSGKEDDTYSRKLLTALEQSDDFSRYVKSEIHFSEALLIAMRLPVMRRRFIDAYQAYRDANQAKIGEGKLRITYSGGEQTPSDADVKVVMDCFRKEKNDKADLRGFNLGFIRDQIDSLASANSDDDVAYLEMLRLFEISLKREKRTLSQQLELRREMVGLPMQTSQGVMAPRFRYFSSLMSMITQHGRTFASGSTEVWYAAEDSASIILRYIDSMMSELKRVDSNVCMGCVNSAENVFFDNADKLTLAGEYRALDLLSTFFKGYSLLNKNSASASLFEALLSADKETADPVSVKVLNGLFPSGLLNMSTEYSNAVQFLINTVIEPYIAHLTRMAGKQSGMAQTITDQIKCAQKLIDVYRRSVSSEVVRNEGVSDTLDRAVNASLHLCSFLSSDVDPVVVADRLDETAPSGVDPDEEVTTYGLTNNPL